ncbi:MAG: hypothetical protein RL246_662 [Bacteroidota bacterium]|jgi:hypothetical protein
MYKSLTILFLILFVFMGLDATAQCAMCRTTVESTISNGRSNIATGLNTGILYLLSAPYLAVAVVAWLWFRQSKKEQQAKIEKWKLRQRVSQLLGGQS